MRPYPTGVQRNVVSAVLNELDRFHLAQAAVDRVGKLSGRRATFAQFVGARLAAYIRQNGEDMPENATGVGRQARCRLVSLWRTKP
jgi:phosphoketolase